MFVSDFPGHASTLTFDPTGLACRNYAVNLEWMLCIALCRGRLDEFANTRRAKELLKSLDTADYVVAPIADNRMYQIIDEFARGEITDAQCEHALSATDLGMQYVIRSERAASKLVLWERCFICEPERADYRRMGEERGRLGQDKARLARRNYRGKGVYRSFSMRRVEGMDLSTCAFQGRCSNSRHSIRRDAALAIFIRRFMRSDAARRVDESGSFGVGMTEEDVLDEVNRPFDGRPYGSATFPTETLYWMGYTYRYWCLSQPT